MKIPHLIPAAMAAAMIAGQAPAQNATLPPESYPGLRTPDGALLPSIAGYLGKDVRSVPRTIDPDLLKRRSNFGYTDEEIQKYFVFPRAMTLDETGLDTSYIKPPPAPGIHPRVMFNPEDVPAIRKRLTETKAGRAAMSAIRERISKMITGPKAQFADQYQALVDGQEVDKLDNNVAYSLMYEAFRCLIDDDKEGGKKAAAAITTLSKIAQREFQANQANPRNATNLNDARVMSQGPTREFTLGLDYDFAYNFMTPEQRDQVRGVLANLTKDMTGLGCETLHALHCGPSNWISWSARMLFAICAIEGEPGYDPGTFKRFADSQVNFIDAIFPTGEAYEGWGKNFMFFEHMVILAKRDPSLNVLGHTSVRSAYNNYFIASLSPWGNNFTFCDSLAKSGGKIARNADVQMYHTLFPHDVAGAFIYRNQINSDYENVGSKNINTSHPFSVMDTLCCAIFASDMSATPEQEEFAAVTKDRPLTYFSEDTSNMITRSAWDKDALYLNYLNRSIPGGHQYCDRSHFNLYADGRFWSIYQGSRQIKEQYMPNMRSVLLADEMGPSTAEAECVSFFDGPQATFIATNLANPWNFQTSGLVKPSSGTELGKKTQPYNAFRLKPSPIPWMNMPIGELPHWYTSQKPDEKEGADWYRRFDVIKAFRTAGLVRGAHPYSLIVDDLKLDNDPHHYTWGMTLAPDVVLETSRITKNTPGAFEADIILAESDKPDLSVAAPSEEKRKLLVRVLSASQIAEPGAVVETIAIPNPPQRDLAVNRLHVFSDCVSPDFKILLYPFKGNAPLPQTTWNADRSSLTVALPGQTDTISFKAGQDGRTRLDISRNGAVIGSTP